MPRLSWKDPMIDQINDRMTDGRAFAALARSALDVLYQVDQEGGCCPLCCAPCRALRDLRFRGRLNDILAVDPGSLGSAWWDETAGGVDDEFLCRAWRLTECHDE